jgi:predicted anti-sigma-YlaC factor YlaD
MTGAELTCRELADFVGDYLSGELAPEVRAVFDEHLAECAECVTYLRSYEDTIRLARDVAGSEPVPPTVPAELVQAILAARRNRWRPF